MHTIKEVSFSRRVLGFRDRSLNKLIPNNWKFCDLKPILMFEINRKEIIVLLKCVKNLPKQACLQLFLRLGLEHWSCKKVACCSG